MTAWPKSFFTIGASALTLRTAHRLRRKNTAIHAQRRTLDALLPKLASTSFWKSHGVEKGMTPAQFKTRVSLRTYKDLASAIERMKLGEADVLWPGQCTLYAESSGTTRSEKNERPKQFPITPEMRAHFLQAGQESLLHYSARTGNSKIFRGRHLVLNGSMATTPAPNPKSLGAFTGTLSACVTHHRSASLEKHFYEPGSDIAREAGWDSKIDGIVNRTKSLDITLLAGMPGWGRLLAEAMSASSGSITPADSHLQQVWPKLECFVHGGAAIAPFADDLRDLLGPTVNFHEIYPAPEAFIAAQDGEMRAGLRLMANAGVYYEFLPMADFDEPRLATLGVKALALEEVRPGVDYALIVTTPAGLCRYAVGDIVRFISTEPPRLQWMGRCHHRLTSFGECVIEKELAETLITICRRNSWKIVNFHVAPLFTNPLLGTTRGRYEWWVELRPGTLINPTGPNLAAELDLELQRTNQSYENRRKGHGLESPIVRLVMPGLFEQWMRRHGKFDAQHKTPGCRNDRNVAEQLAEIAQFAKD